MKYSSACLPARDKAVFIFKILPHKQCPVCQKKNYFTLSYNKQGGCLLPSPF